MSYLISLILLILPAYLIRFSVFGIPTTLLELVIYLIFLYGLYRAFKTKFRPMPKPIYLSIGLLFIALVISTYIAPDRRVALGELKGFFLDPILVFWLTFQFIKVKDWPKIFWALIISGFFVSFDTIILKFLGRTTTDGRVIGLFGYSPNYISLYIAPITVLIFSQIFPFRDYRGFAIENWQIKKSRFLAIALTLILINLVAIYFSGSRGGVLAVGAGIGIFLIAHFWHWIHAHLSSQIIIAIIILLAIYTSWSLFKPDFSASLSSGRVVTSNNLRWQIWQETLKLGAAHPILGIGLGNYQNAFGQFTQNIGNYPEYITPQALSAHNIFLMFWLSSGLLGLVAFLCLVVLFYRQVFCLKDIRANVPLAVVSSIIIYGLIESSISKNDLGIIFWVMWGLIWTI